MTSEKHHCALSKSISFQEMRYKELFLHVLKILISIFFVTYHLYRGSMTIVPWSITPGQLPPHEVPLKKFSPRTFTHQTIFIIIIIIIIIHLFQFGFTNYST